MNQVLDAFKKRKLKLRQTPQINRYSSLQLVSFTFPSAHRRRLFSVFYFILLDFFQLFLSLSHLIYLLRFVLYLKKGNIFNYLERIDRPRSINNKTDENAKNTNDNVGCVHVEFWFSTEFRASVKSFSEASIVTGHTSIIRI